MLAPTKDDLRAEQQGGVSAWYIAGRAGISDRSAAWILSTIRQLIAQEGFPKALPHFDLQGRKRPEINLHSRWVRPAVDAWFDGQMPPHLAEVAANRQAANDAQKLDARAGELAGAAATGAPR